MGNLGNDSHVASLLTERALGIRHKFKLRAVLARRAQWTQTWLPFPQRDRSARCIRAVEVGNTIPPQVCVEERFD
jgi:hypothetical protein